jgi:putative PIN family toxin of toxin-antitoxin system
MTQEGKLRVVFDCNIFFQATRNERGPAGEALRLLESGAFSLFVSSAVLEEVRDVLRDPDVRSKNPSITDQVVVELFERLRTTAELVLDVPKHFALERDPSDAHYVDVALAAKANYLVTRDNDLLDLMQDRAFRTRYPDLTILNPVSFLKEVAGRGRS